MVCIRVGSYYIVVLIHFADIVDYYSSLCMLIGKVRAYIYIIAMITAYWHSRIYTQFSPYPSARLQSNISNVCLPLLAYTFTLYSISKNIYTYAFRACFYFCYYIRLYGGKHCVYFARPLYGGKEGIFQPILYRRQMYCRFVLIRQDSSGYLVQTAYISPFAFFVKYFNIISTDGLRVTS